MAVKLDVPESTLDGFRLERVIEHEPGFLSVYDARSESSGERVSVRAFPVPRGRTASIRFRRHAQERVAAAHAGLPSATEAIERDGRLYLVMEALSAPTLKARIAHQPLRPREAVQLLQPVAAAVDEIRWLRDAILDSRQILVAETAQRERAVLLDPAKGVSLREAGWPWMHPYAHYAPPELGSGKHLGTPTLVYSLGCILFEAVAGSPPYEGDWLALVEAHSATPIPPASERRADLGAGLDKVLARAMAKDPDERFQSARALLRAAATAVGQESAGSSRSPTLERRVGEGAGLKEGGRPAGGKPPPAGRGARDGSPDGPRAGSAPDESLVVDPEADARAPSQPASESAALDAFALELHLETLLPEEGASEESFALELPPMEQGPKVREPIFDVSTLDAAPALPKGRPRTGADVDESERRPKPAPRRTPPPRPPAKRARRPEPPPVAQAPSGTEPADSKSTRRRRAGLAILACALTAVCAIAGYLAGRQTTPPAQTTQASAGPFSLQLPSGWKRRSRTPALTGVSLPSVIAAGPRGSQETGIVAGRTDRSAKDDLPPGLRAPQGQRAEPVRLGSYDAYRRRGLRAGDTAQRFTTYSIPIAGGAAVLACHATDRAAGAFLPGCERIASTVDLRGLQALSIRDLVADRRRTAAIVAELRRLRSAGRRRLAVARRSSRRVSEARALQAAYADAGRSFARAETGTEPSDWKAKVLRTTTAIERGYGRLAQATARRSPSRYAKARRSVIRSEADLARLLVTRRSSP